MDIVCLIICIGVLILAIYMLRAYILYGGQKSVGLAALTVIVPPENNNSGKELSNKAVQIDREDTAPSHH